MDAQPTISESPRHSALSHGGPVVCWCGQDIEHLQASYCPRCGTAFRRTATAGTSALGLAA
jgi:predicted amidophosphoribosyltransferase